MKLQVKLDDEDIVRTLLDTAPIARRLVVVERKLGVIRQWAMDHMRELDRDQGRERLRDLVDRLDEAEVST